MNYIVLLAVGPLDFVAKESDSGSVTRTEVALRVGLWSKGGNCHLFVKVGGEKKNLVATDLLCRETGVIAARSDHRSAIFQLLLNLVWIQLLREVTAWSCPRCCSIE